MYDVFVDEETGESLERPPLRANSSRSTTPNFTDPENNNVETGEPEEADEHPSCRRRVPFQIPRALQRQDDQDDDDEVMIKSVRRKDNKYLSKMKKKGRAEPFGQTNPILLFVPIVFYFQWVISILMCLEVLIHVWAHHKNKRLKNLNVYFRSPFHSITSEFCALCQSETCMDRVGKLQAVRADKFLRQCNYMKRVVT